MARITVEDCIHFVPNRFNLVMLAAKRAHQLERGARAFLEWDNDKPTVVALREIAEGKINLANIEENEVEKMNMALVGAGEPFGETIEED